MPKPAAPLRLLLPLLLCHACGAPSAPRERQTPSGKYYGGVFSANESEELLSLFPLSLTQAAAHRIAAQVLEGLVRLDARDLSVKPALAESWETDATGLVYTFRIREGVRFHDDECFPDGRGRLLTAQDVVACFNRLCTRHEENVMFWLIQDRVVGANAHYASGAPASEPVKGITAIDERTVRFELAAPWPAFLQVLAHQGCWIYPQEAWDHYGDQVRWHPLGTGPFRVRSFERGKAMVLERWAHYWGRDDDGSQLPYLDAIRYTFEPDKEKELDAFLKGALTVVYELPVSRTDVLEADHGFQVQSTPALSIQFYGFNLRKPPFNDPRVRRAFAMAIDRRSLVDSVLAGLGIVPEHGVVAPGIGGYPYERVPGLDYDPAGARKLLAEAGYAGGKGLPTIFLQVNSNGFGYVKVAERAQAMLERELGVLVTATVLPAEQHFNRVASGEPLLWREGWIADHPDPENFLSLFYGRNAPADTAAPSYLNSTRHHDARFDSLFALAAHTQDPEERMRLFAMAEARLMEELPVIPLYHERSIRLLQPRVRDFPINGMEYRDLRTVWMEPGEPR
ncbi:MAG: ABC transporter substrate-binding protein [Flavobacteriales bacterium]